MRTRNDSFLNNPSTIISNQNFVIIPNGFAYIWKVCSVRMHCSTSSIYPKRSPLGFWYHVSRKTCIISSRFRAEPNYYAYVCGVIFSLVLLSDIQKMGKKPAEGKPRIVFPQTKSGAAIMQFHVRIEMRLRKKSFFRYFCGKLFGRVLITM